jgi:hypothetical protein
MRKETWRMGVGLGALLIGVAVLAGAGVEGARFSSRIGGDVAPPVKPDWRAPLGRAELALLAGDVPGAERAWEDAYRLAIQTWDPASTLELGRAYLGIGTAAHGHAAANDRARRIFLSAFYQARALRSPEAMANAAEALAAVGDLDLATRGFALALTVAERSRDGHLIERVKVQRDRVAETVEPSTADPARAEAARTR